MGVGEIMTSLTWWMRIRGTRDLHSLLSGMAAMTWKSAPVYSQLAPFAAQLGNVFVFRNVFCIFSLLIVVVVSLFIVVVVCFVVVVVVVCVCVLLLATLFFEFLVFLYF